MTTPKLKIAPSILSADFARLAEEIKRVEAAGCDWLHIDVMDGHFVPNLTVGPLVVRAIRPVTRLFLDTHLMIEHPGRYIDAFADAGSDSIIVHAEACRTADDLRELLKKIKGRGLRAGVSLRPATPAGEIDAALKHADQILVMTVHPGFGGQAFMPEVLPKITEIRKRFPGDIAVDGGINPETAGQAVRAGANVLVAGTAVFGKPDAKKAIDDLRAAG